ncbi:MAG: resolvase [Candidatus Verstraetearchaeota archaeon]|jgi:Holliday junction resolvase|nr:resolvase [Candidatus Verstraetearchaeota archaeon]
MSLDKIKLARIRKNRGQGFEREIVKRYREAGWWAYRVGGYSAYLPDVIATNDEKGEFHVIEAKAGTKDYLYIEWDQIERDIELLNGFKRYPIRRIILAFKFLAKKSKKPGVYERRELREYFKELPQELWDKLRGKTISCNYEKGCPELPDFNPPFKVKK